MRIISPLDALLPRGRQALLAALVLQPHRTRYLSELAHDLEVRPSSLQRDLAALVDAGILRRGRDGNRVTYQPDPSCPIMPDLQGLFAKTVGLADVLRDCLAAVWDRVDFAFVYGSVARRDETSVSDVDLMAIGRVRLADLAQPLREGERRLQRPINPAVYSLEELATNLADGHHFLTTVMQGPKLFLRGTEDELGQAVGRAQSQASHQQ